MCLLGSSGALRGTNGVSAEIVLTLGCEMLSATTWDPDYQHQGQKDAGYVPPGALSGHMGYDMGRFHGTLRFRISIGLYKRIRSFDRVFCL